MARRFLSRRTLRRGSKALLYVAALVTAVVVIAEAGLGLHDRWNQHFDWRDDEYARLTSLAAGFSRTVFETKLGPAVFDRRSKDGSLREQTFRGRGYWVQAVSNRSRTVVLYAVTACDPDFQPEFSLPGGGPPLRLRLNSTTFAGIAPSATADYFIGGATANVRFHEYLGAGNPSHYQTAIWGINDACPNWLARLQPLQRDGDYPPMLVYEGSGSSDTTWLAGFRRRAVINTYAETAPDFYPEDLRDYFQVGVDRILTRTVIDHPD